MTTLRRISRLEAIHSPAKKYLCVVGGEFNANGFRVQSRNGEPDFILETRKKLDEFAAQPGIELTVLNVKYRDDVSED